MPLTFRLPDATVDQLVRQLDDPWERNEFGHLIFLSRYSRKKADGSKETWGEVVRRCVEGSYSIQRDWCLGQRIPWSDAKAYLSAVEMFTRMYEFKFTPPGRGLWMMGTEFVHDRVGSAALQNCAFVSTRDLIRAAEFLMEASMLGVGVGFDTTGAGSEFKVGEIDPHTLVIGDSREGWVSSTSTLLAHYLEGASLPEFDYSLIRPAGSPIVGFGGTAAGPGPLRELHASIVHLFKNAKTGDRVSTRDVVDLMNLIGRCVVAGNVRRSAEVALSPPSEEFLNLKNYDMSGHARHPAAEGRSEFGWASNNSIIARTGDTDYHAIAELIAANGEPGVFWLDTSREFGRLGDPATNADYRVAGSNPCMEQSLESYEMCNLVETYPSNHYDRADFLRTLKFAYLYAKSVTLLPTHWPETNAIMLRNRRIGCSITGAWQFAEEFGLPTLRSWMRDGYDEIKRWDDLYSEWLCVRPSIKTTSIKPSGTVSKLVHSRYHGERFAGITPGVHPPVAQAWIQRVIFAPDDPVFLACQAAGYRYEPSLYTPNSFAVEFPVVGPPVRTQAQVSMWEKASIAALAQRDWADNAVSVTVTFDPATESSQIGALLHATEGQFKALSFLPLSVSESYGQVPMEEKPMAEVVEYRESLRPLDLSSIYAANASSLMADASGERFCDTDVCELPG